MKRDAPVPPAKELASPPLPADALPPARAGEPATTELGQPPAVSSLTPEEQMALFEKELKEKDWGHQPC